MDPPARAIAENVPSHRNLLTPGMHDGTNNDPSFGLDELKAKYVSTYLPPHMATLPRPITTSPLRVHSTQCTTPPKGN